MAAWIFAGAGICRFMLTRVNVNSWFGNRAPSSYDRLMLFYYSVCTFLKMEVKQIKSCRAVFFNV